MSQQRGSESFVDGLRSFRLKSTEKSPNLGRPKKGCLVEKRPTKEKRQFLTILSNKTKPVFSTFREIGRPSRLQQVSARFLSSKEVEPDQVRNLNILVYYRKVVDTPHGIFTTFIPHTLHNTCYLPY